MRCGAALVACLGERSIGRNNTGEAEVATVIGEIVQCHFKDGKGGRERARKERGGEGEGGKASVRVWPKEKYLHYVVEL